MIAPASAPYVRSYELEKLVNSEKSAEIASQRSEPTTAPGVTQRQLRVVRFGAT